MYCERIEIMTKLPDNIQKWVDALRSGEYKQTKNTLKEVTEGGETVGYCCLGVYAEVHKLNGYENMGVVFDESGDVINEGPEEIYDRIRDNVYDYIVNEGIEMNEDGYSFDEIADMIEEEYTNWYASES